jgi:hypothetical protein
MKALKELRKDVAPHVKRKLIEDAFKGVCSLDYIEFRDLLRKGKQHPFVEITARRLHASQCSCF